MKIVLIGDSIRQGYDRYVEMAYQGIAQVFYPDCNCRFTTNILRFVGDWKRAMGCGDDVDLVHWNAGLWDNKTMADGKPLVPLACYGENVGRICNVLSILFPKAKTIFATSTPCIEGEFLGTLRRNIDIEQYNNAACQAVKQHGSQINDLYKILRDAPPACHSDNVHYYTKEGTRIITNQVIDSIQKAIGINAKPLDYDLLFSETGERIEY